MRRRVPDFLRTPLLISALLALHFAMPGGGEAVRLRLLRVVSRPLPLRGAVAGLVPPVVRALPVSFPERGGVLSVLDLEPERGLLIVGGGAEDGVAPGARVVVPSGLIGVVDQVTTHLARVRLLSAKDVQVPVVVTSAAAGRPLPGGLEQLMGVLRGDGTEAGIVSAHLPREFRRDDVLTSLADDDGESWPVGRIMTEGLRPHVELLGAVHGESAVLVAGAETPTEALFAVHPCQVVLLGGGRVRGVLLVSDTLESVSPGCGVHFGARYLGRVVRIAGGVAHVVGAGDAGSPLDVLLISDDGGSTPARLMGRGEGRFSFEPSAGASQVPRGTVRVVTAGGQELVRPGLEVGRGAIDGDRLTLEEVPPWPRTVGVSVFRYGAERARLRGRR